MANARPVATHGCRAVSCPAQVASGMLLCGEHWVALPRVHQRHLRRTREAYRRTGRERERLEYQDAVTAALEALRTIAIGSAGGIA